MYPFANICSVMLLSILLGGLTPVSVCAQEALRTHLLPISSARTANNTVSATTYTQNGLHLLFSGGDGGALDVYKLHPTGELSLLQTCELYNKKGPARGLTADRIEGTDYLFVGNKRGNAVEVFRIQTGGTLERVFVLHDTEETYLGTVITLKVVHMQQASYLFVGGLEATPGLSCFAINPDGSLHHIQSIEDDDQIHTDGIIGMYAHQIEDKTFLFTGGFQDNGISSFRVYEDGHFEHVHSLSDNTTDRYLTGTYPVDGITLGQTHYVIVGHRHHKYYKRANFIKQQDFVYHGDAVSVFRVNQAGKLIPHFTLVDDEQTKLAGQTRIEILPLTTQEALVAIGTRDDSSIQICHIGEDGILVPTGVYTTHYPIYYGMASHKLGNELFFLAGSVDNSVKKVFSYKVELQGNAPERDQSDKVLRHVVSFKFKEEVTANQVNKVVHDFQGLREKIPVILDFEWGINNSQEGHSKGFTHGFMLTFQDEAARDAYLTHPDHLILVDRVGPLLEDVFVIDYWTK